MAQENGLHFKLLYPYWYNGDNIHVPFPNGLLPFTINWMKDVLKHQVTPIEVDDIDRLLPLRPFYDDTSYCHFFRHADFYRHFKITFGKNSIVSLNDLDSNDSNDVLYFYPIEIESDRFRFLHNSVAFKENEKDSTYNFVDTIPQKVLDLIELGKVKLIISFMVDPVERLEFLNYFEEKIINKGINPKNVIVLSGNIDFDYAGDMILLDSIISLYQTSHTIPLYPFETSLGYISDYVKVDDIDKSKIREKKFLSFNRNLNSDHRIAFCWTAIKHNLLNDGYFSFLTNLNPGAEYMLSKILPDDDLNDLLSKVDNIKNLIPYELDTQHIKNKLGFTTNENNKKEFYLNSYFHITTETEFTSNRSSFLSEKTWRPILNLQPFVFFGNPFSLKKLQDLGFKTFSPYIDESYDSIKDKKERFRLVNKEILRLQALPLEEIHIIYNELFDRLVYNQKLLKEKIDYNPLTTLINYEFK
jgi:hypothetical protein